MADRQQHHGSPHRQPPPPPLRSQAPPRPPPPRLLRSATQGILNLPSTSAAGLNRSTEAIPAYTEVVMRNRPNQNTGSPINRISGDRSKFRRTQSMRVLKKRHQRRPQITIVSSQPMSEHPAFADGLKGGFVPPEAPPSYAEVLKQRRSESFTVDGEQPKVTSDDAFADRLTYRDIEIYSSSSPPSNHRQPSASVRRPPTTPQASSTASEQFSSHEMLVGLQSVPSDAASTTTTASNGAASDPPTDVPVVAACRTSLPSTTAGSTDQPRKIPIKPPRRKSSASAPRRPTVPPPKPLVVAPPKPVTITEVVVLPPKPVLPAKPVVATAVPSEAAVSPSVSVSNETALPSRPLSTVSIVDIDEASGYATLNFVEGEPAEQQNGDNPAEEPIVESTTEETPQPPQTTEDTEAEQPGKMIANEAIYAKLNKKPGRKPPSRPQIKPRGPPPVPAPAVVEVEEDDVPPPLPTTRPPPEPESSPELPSKPVPKPRSRVSSSVKPAGAVEYNSAAVRVSFVDDVMETTDDDEAFQRRSDSSVVPHSTPPPPPPEDRRSPQPSIQPNEATVIESPAPTVDPSPKDKKSSKMGVLRSKSLRWTKGKFKNLKKDAPKSSSPGPDSPKPAAVITTPDENRRSVSRSVSTSAAPRKPPSPAHRVPSRPSRPLSQTAASPKPPSERRAPPPRPRPPVRPPPPKISSIDHVKIRSPTKVMERHREKVVDEKMRSYMAHQGYYVALCNHTDFSDLTFCTGDRIFVMYPIADDLVFGRNEDGEEGPFPLSCVRPEDDGGAAAMMMSMNENNQSNVNVSRASSYQPPSSSSSRWSSSSDGLQLNSAQEKCSPSHIRGQRRVTPARPIRPPVPSTPEKTLISTEPPLQQEMHLSSQHQHIGDRVEVSEKWDEEKVDAIPTNGSMGEEVQYSVEVADTTTEDDMVTNDISHDLQAPTIVVPTTPTKSSSNISSAIVCENTAAKTPPTSAETPPVAPVPTETPTNAAKTPLQTAVSSAVAPAKIAEETPNTATKTPPVAPLVAPSFHVIALYTYDTGVEGDLNFEAGDVLRVTRTVDELWYEGSSARDSYTKVGIFPQVYAKSIQEGIVNIYDLFPALAKGRRRR